MIISFAWTTPALLAGAKTMTRREWTPSHASRFCLDDMVDAWNRSPRAGRSSGARKVATIRLTQPAYPQDTARLTAQDYVREGFTWLSINGSREDRDRIHAIWTDWHVRPRTLWVVEFELVELVGVESAGGRPQGESLASTEHLSNRRGDHART